MAEQVSYSGHSLVPTHRTIAKGVLYLVGLLLTAGVHGETRTATLFLDSQRPVAKAVEALTSEHAVVVTYEDPRYEHDGDMRGALHLEYAAASMSGEPNDWAITLRAVLEANEYANGAGRFRLRQSGQVFHLLPTAKRDEGGQWVAQESVLEAALSIRAAELRLDEMLSSFCAEVSRETGMTVQLGELPTDVAQHRVLFGVTENETARSVLTRMLHSVDENMTWQLLYEPFDERYVLHIYRVGAGSGGSIIPVVDLYHDTHQQSYGVRFELRPGAKLP